VGGVIIHDDMDIEPARDVSVDLFEEVQELDRPVALVAFADHKSRGDIKCSEQRCRAMPHIAVRVTFRHARHTKDQSVARSPAALSCPLHADFRVMDQSGRALVR
jgi:hypothetical protein